MLTTNQELAIRQLRQRSLTARQIAARLDLPPETVARAVDYYRAQVQGKTFARAKYWYGEEEVAPYRCPGCRNLVTARPCRICRMRAMVKKEMAHV